MALTGAGPQQKTPVIKGGGIKNSEIQRERVLEQDGQDESRTSAPLLGGWVQDLPAAHFRSQVTTVHPALYPHMEVPVIDGGDQKVAQEMTFPPEIPVLMQAAAHQMLSLLRFSFLPVSE